MNKLISVLMPVKNAEDTILEAIQSITIQEGVDFEIIVVEDGCDSATRAHLMNAVAGNSKIKLLTNAGSGIAAALNTGLLYCSGAYIARMDADDLMLPNRLKNQAVFLESNPGTGLVSGLVKYESGGSTTGYQFYCEQLNQIREAKEILHSRLVESPVAHPSVMFRKELVEQFGGYSEECVPEDYELWLRWLSKGVVFNKLRQHVLLWRDSPDRASRKLPQYSRAAFDKVRMLYLIEELRQRVNSETRITIAGGGKYARKKIKQLIKAGFSVERISDLIERKIDGIQFQSWNDLVPEENRIVISFVSNRGAWKEIQNDLESRGFLTGVDYFPCG
ncbi:MAG: glycosyltransferase [Bacteroidetes bacterium]|nr:glycosyltransferase [Bacteroidota bacterium]